MKTALTIAGSDSCGGESTPEFLKDQIDMVFEDIRPDAIKIGMVASGELIDTIAERLSDYKLIISWLIRLWLQQAVPSL